MTSHSPHTYTSHFHSLMLTHARPQYPNIPAHKTLSPPPTVTKTNYIHVTFHFHTPATENIKMSKRVTPCGRCFILYCFLFHLNYSACVGLGDSFNVQLCAMAALYLCFTYLSRIEIFLAHKEEGRGGGEKKMFYSKL